MMFNPKDFEPVTDQDLVDNFITFLAYANREGFSVESVLVDKRTFSVLKEWEKHNISSDPNVVYSSTLYGVVKVINNGKEYLRGRS